MTQILDDDTKNVLGKFCSELFDEIKTINKRKHSIVIQLNKDVLYVGTGASMFKADYYNSTCAPMFATIKNICDKYEYVMHELFDKIKVDTSHKRLKSFNVFYSGKSRTICVCLNRIGSICIRRSLLYKPFVVQM